jgi:hypothetical protein
MKKIVNFVVLSLPLLGSVPAALAQETSGWHLDTSLNLFLAGLGGDVGVKGLTTHVDSSFGDIAKQLQFAAAGRATLGYDRFLLSTEFSYMKLSASVPGASVNLKQWLVEPSLGYQINDYIEAFAGARYNNIQGALNFTGPLGLVTSGTQEWWDPIVGAQLSFPLVGKKLTMDGRFDVGGFGVGSQLTWQAYPYLNWHFTSWGSAQLGYRWLATDYHTGSGRSAFLYDVLLQGPEVGLTIHF